MDKKIIIILALLAIAAYFSAQQSKEILINGIYFQQNGDLLRQMTRTGKHLAMFGVLSDIHGNVNNTAFFVRYFVGKGVDGFLLPGDIVEHFRNNVPDDKELNDILQIVASSGLPVFVIPGNHETKEVYNNVLSKLGKDNVIDMAKIRRVDMELVTILSLPGYNIASFVAEDGFMFGEKELDMLRSFSHTRQKKILFSHQIPKSKRAGGIDNAYSLNHAGDATLASIMAEEKIDVSVGSHIHEAGGQAETRGGVFVPQNTYSETLYLNPGSVTNWAFLNGTAYNGLAALLTINGTHAAYEVIAIH